MSLAYSNEQLNSTPSGHSTQPELLVSALLHLMSHYSVNARQSDGSSACLKLAAVIERHLKALTALPNLAPVLHATCLQLSEQWAGLIDAQLPQSSKPRRFSWMNATPPRHST
ncbi:MULTISPECIES: hypothetical protein [unclassified Undibacterium]|uniref:hypothetical protein n=1 Tax=unclassified Undibacterium TaxID=2630295 RepID=UPI002AC8A1CF|nr:MULTISPECIES: hypothetical protein [unclassified Undibacterium]MEB0139232.1 hypothetical protein [Undibacterium sp. CCC2.1]MEB0172076.1 hypothetical protein [Undibacterium sp. CCC1.1]MEB0175951.1 hypothetical protein [Undibacterium sp. CCC3.4]MEB0215263.1 hypothetical protein [Undibacterium sp. 5I2]WPX45438.1 hypothetical protein RHM61_09580 [Undibacterium sp. CCC3.4]